MTMESFAAGATNSSNSSDYFYDYDYDASVNYIALAEVVPVALVYGLTFVIGVLGNSLVIFCILRYRRMQTVTNVFLISLSFADLLLIILCVPIKLAKWFTFTWQFGAVLCKLVHYMQNVSVFCSTLTLTLMSIERYYAIIYPMKAKVICTSQRAKRGVALMWVLSVVFAAPILQGQKQIEVGVKRAAYWCVKEWSSHFVSQIYEIFMIFTVLIFPMVIINFAYIRIIIKLWILTRENNSAANDNPAQFTLLKNAGRKDDSGTRKQVVKMLVLVIVLFIICWSPILIDNVLKAFMVVDEYNYGNLKYMRQAFTLMSYFNSCLNPIVYAFMSKNFRKSFKRALQLCVRRKSNRGAFIKDETTRTFSKTTSVRLTSFAQSKRKSRLRRNEIEAIKEFSDEEPKVKQNNMTSDSVKTTSPL